jgi:hypothetical protein
MLKLHIGSGPERILYYHDQVRQRLPGPEGNVMFRFLGVLVGLVLVVASASLFAQSRTVPKQFDNVRSLGRALAEFKDDRIQVVVSYAESQVHHDSRWLLIELGALGGRTRMNIERARIELVTPDGRLVPHATPDRFQEAADVAWQLRRRRASSATRLDWYLPSAWKCCSSLTQRILRISLAPLNISRYGPSLADLLFESTTGAWDDGLYALVVPYDGSEAA